jgi:hypothetical protein
MVMSSNSFEQDGLWWYEGEHCSLIRDWSYNTKYTHHPIVAAQDLGADPSLRHLSPAELWSAVLAYGAVRQSAAYDHLARVAVAVPETRKNIVLRHGARCLCCDQWAWEPQAVNEYGWVSPNALGAFEALVSDQFDYIKIFDGYGLFNTVPALCSDCTLVARTTKQPWRGYSWRYDDTNALRGVIALVEHLAQGLTP